jgi:tRNA(adenine34) deaminase
LLWKYLSPPWQGCIEEAWVAYCIGSLPIGSVITDAHGNILARGHNRVHKQPAEERVLTGHRLAHAELNALLCIDLNTINPCTCILYTTTEPCPLCVGAIRMALIGEVRYASRDEIAGSATLFESTPFLRKGNVKVVGPQNADLETILVGLLVEFALTHENDYASTRYEQLASIDSRGARLGKVLFASRQLYRWKNEGKMASFILDELAQCVKQDRNT